MTTLEASLLNKGDKCIIVHANAWSVATYLGKYRTSGTNRTHYRFTKQSTGREVILKSPKLIIKKQ